MFVVFWFTLAITFLLDHYLVNCVDQLTEAGKGEDSGRGEGCISGYV
jgi:hypothetical protein